MRDAKVVQNGKEIEDVKVIHFCEYHHSPHLGDGTKTTKAYGGAVDAMGKIAEVANKQAKPNPKAVSAKSLQTNQSRQQQ